MFLIFEINGRISKKWGLMVYYPIALNAWNKDPCSCSRSVTWFKDLKFLKAKTVWDRFYVVRYSSIPFLCEVDCFRRFHRETLPIAFSHMLWKSTSLKSFLRRAWKYLIWDHSLLIWNWIFGLLDNYYLLHYF